MSDLVLEGRSTEDGQPVRIIVRDGSIAAIERSHVDPGDVWVSPGWMDIQINGYAGFDPNAPGSTDAVVAGMVRALWAAGVTASCITICTESAARMVESIAAISRACNADPMVAASIAGIHVEGPHIATEDGPRGAHPLRHVRPPDINEFRRWQDAARGLVRIVTLSPEYAEAASYIAAVVADGVVASIGHTTASGGQITAAVDAGARWSTHLGNGAHAVMPRHPNYIWDQLAEDRLSAGFIFDGIHLPPDVMKTVIRAKGVERSILVSDAVAVAGLPVGEYEMFDGSTVVLQPSGRLELKGTPYLAGSVTSLGPCLMNAVRYAGVTFGDAVRMVTSNPARLLGLPIAAGHDSLRIGMAANLTVARLDSASLDLEVLRTVVAGTVVYDSAAN